MASDDQKYEDAREKVDSRIGFFIHAAVFVVINVIFLAAIGWDWLWVTLFWGIGLVMHGVATFVSGPGGMLGEYREKAIQKEMTKGSAAAPPPPPTS